MFGRRRPEPTATVLALPWLQITELELCFRSAAADLFPSAFSFAMTSCCDIAARAVRLKLVRCDSVFRYRDKLMDLLCIPSVQALEKKFVRLITKSEEVGMQAGRQVAGMRTVGQASTGCYDVS